MPADFDFVGNQENVTAVLENCVVDKESEVRRWLENHKDFTNVLLSRTDSLSLDLVYLICNEIHDFSLLYNSNKPWNELYAWAKPKGSSVEWNVFLTYFKNRDEDFVVKCNLQATVDAEFATEIVEQLLEDAGNYFVVLKYMAKAFFADNLPVIENFVTNGVDVSHIYEQLSATLSDTSKEQEPKVRSFFKACKDAGVNIKDVISQNENLSDELLIELFIQTAEVEFLNRVAKFDDIPAWLNNQAAECLQMFLNSCESAFSSEEDIEALAETMRELDENLFRDAIKEKSIDEQYRTLQLCPKDYAQKIVLSHFKSTELFDLYIGEQWEKLKCEIPYVAFDLETDGETIAEFAFRKEENTRVYEGEEQLNSLLRALKNTEIIVGHRIKDWDLEVLSKKGFKPGAFIWDTLEIEILLNPCRYSYALHTTHTAKDDTELVDRLFWNQLFRLSQNLDLCLELKDLLPPKINTILYELRQPIFADFFKQSADSNDVFYQELYDTDEEIASKLKLIEVEVKNDKTLIVAPKRLWARIAEHVNLSFPQQPEGLDFLSISKRLLNEKPVDDILVNAILNRFLSLSRTPIVANIAQYLRLNYLPDNLLLNYVEQPECQIQCADLSVIVNVDFVKKFKRVYFIGCEIENRINQYVLPTQYSPSDFWSQNSSIPMRLGGSSYIAVTDEERQMPIFNDVPKDAANVWIERTHNGKYIINYNYDFYSSLNRIKESDTETEGFSVSTIPWTTPLEDNNSVHLVHSVHRKGYDATQKRVSPTSRYRATYWTYQFALLRHIHDNKDCKPIIYLLDDLLEKEHVEQYAREMGFYVPENGTLIRKLELIEHHTNGMLIVGKEQFFDVVQWRKDTPFCYVWDHLAVEKHMMMWHGFINDKNKSLLQDGIDEKGKDVNIGSTKDTYQSALLSLWPVYEYYFRFIKANSAESSMFILDPFLEEYHTLASVWDVGDFEIKSLWENEDSYEEDLAYARGFFSDNAETYHNDSDVKTAMDVILATLIKSENVPNPKWSTVQEEVLPQILRKEENFLVSLPTGGGKSVLFQGPALYNAAYTNKLSIVVTPLKALMQDQVKELGDKGFITNVDYLNGDRSYQEVRSIYRKINGGEMAILYVTPERFRSRAFLNALTTRMANDNGLEYMVFDEAHCISQWGMEFRPEYLNVIKKCKELSDTYGKNMCIAMFSATVTDMIHNQINEIVPVKRLGQDNDKKIYNPIRSHIGMSIIEVEHDKTYRLNEIVNYIMEHDIQRSKSRMLVFCKTRNQCEELSLLLADKLSEIGVLPKDDATHYVGYFHAGMDGDDREDTYNRFKDDKDDLYILCATKAFGMGMDIPNIHYIIHYSPPSVMEDYLQEVGRAGRNKEMYKSVGFGEENPIPTVCLFSKEDLKKAKEQLLQSSLSWINLEEIRTAIINYITRIQPIAKTKEYPVVVPNTLWANGQFDHDFTDFRVGLYWLERMNRIKMGYLSPAHINISLKDEENTRGNNLSRTSKGRYVDAVMNEIRAIAANSSNEGTVQVSVQDLSARLCLHSTKVLDTLLLCQKFGLICIEQETRCRVAFTRLSEVKYLFPEQSSYNYFSSSNTRACHLAFHIILDATRRLLQNNGLKIEKNYSLSEIRHFVIEESASLDELVKEVNKTLEDGSTKSEKYMIWHDDNDNIRNKGLSLAKSYREDLYKKRIRQVFTLLEIIPDVKVQSYLDTEHKCVRQSVIVEKPTWKNFLNSFQEDCIKVLQYVHKQQANIVRWSDVVINLDLTQKGYTYFESILRFLNGMAYIATDALLPTGIEVYATDKTEDVILENLEDTSEDFENKKAFDEAREIRNLRLCVMDVLTTKIKSKQEFQELISAYFSITNAAGFIELLGKYYNDDEPIWEAIRATAIKNAEEQLKDNPEQLAIYNENSNVNVNVEAGPGSGKTHVLTLKCAKLIYHQHVKPQSILVLAYNRAVVVELKSRLARLFASLGLSRSASQLHVYTFHGLAKRVCGEKALEGKEMSEWEGILLNTIQNKPAEVRAAMPDLQYVFIDEFQDITQTRLDAMLELREIFNPLTFFTIGDKDQSIYGFEKQESMDPSYYYDQLYEKLKPKKMTMTTNYRSYPKILSEASRFLPETSKVPVACRNNREHEPSTDYVHIYEDGRDWSNDFCECIQNLKNQGVNDAAVFFRTNNEVYHGYSQIRSLNIPGVRIRIQGTTAGEMYRLREIYAVLKHLDDNGNKRLSFENDETEKTLRKKIEGWTNNEKMKSWDTFYMDFAFVLILDYLDFARSDEDEHTYADMADGIRETLKEDNPQIYKLYDDKRFEGRRLFSDKQMNVVLTTMHKVKGLEFDAVIITSSLTSLPFNPANDIPVNAPISERDREQIEEEKRLLYVAYTRAKKFLFVYKGARELAVENVQRFASLEDQWGIRERNVGLDNYNIGYNAGYNFANNKYIAYSVKKNDPVSISRYSGIDRFGQEFSTFNIVHNGVVIGQLSRRSSIAKGMERERINFLQGFFVTDVFYWTYQDTVAADQRNGTNYSSKWCEAAKKQGYIFIVNIAGYGHTNN